ncbi:MAG: hypothetical protein J2P37_06075 [Ktedonobacteraceae bacterium]|nr:hypothetical protein [Ktedonobacteraceae bacterium]MBO0790229.1 hypothetical protein [Ktedonobacteraceae bacterium]
MECSEPGMIRDEELIAYLEGEQVRPAVKRHLARCQRCASQLATYRRQHRLLAGKLYRWDCPPNQVLGEYHLGLLDEQQAAEVRQHVGACALCAAEVAGLVAFLAQDSMPVTHSPTSNHHAMRDIRQVLDQMGEQVAGGVNRIIATLLPSPRLSHVRDAAQHVSSWPRRYGAGEIHLSLQVERGRNDELRLIGFVTRKETALEALQGTPVHLLAQDGTSYTQEVDDLGNFVFSALAAATYALELHFSEGIVAIEHIAIHL